MQANAFKRNAYRTVSVKRTKTAFRTLLARKTPVAFSAQAIINLKADTSRLLMATQPYLLGLQLNDEIRSASRGVIGDIYQHTVILARASKARLPGSGKKLTLKGITLTQALLELDAKATSLLEQLTTVFEGEEVDLVELKPKIEGFILHLYSVTYSLLKVTPSVVMEEQQSKLDEQYGEGFFAPKPKGTEAAQAS